jgi:hypothetical protein
MSRKLYQDFAVGKRMRKAGRTVPSWRVVRRRKPVVTRGLNHNCNLRLKEVLISAATGGSLHEPYKPFLEKLKQNGMRAGDGSTDTRAQDRRRRVNRLETRSIRRN